MYVPEAILFDLDDTIITWTTPGDVVWQNICRFYAPSVEGLFDAIRRAREWYWSDEERHRLGRNDLLRARREVIRLAFSFLGIDSTDLADRIADAYSAEREESASLVPGAISTLDRLKKQDIRLALVTNGGVEIQRGKINKFALEPFFDFILVEGEFGTGKPDFRVFNHVLKILNVRAGDAWMVGDDLKRDIAPCLSLGIYTVWVNGQYAGLTSEGPKPDRIIRNISELDGFVQAAPYCISESG
jgi:putative hydrolase of the HAD superfamily